MTSDDRPAVILGNYRNFKNIPTRGFVQLIIEVPIEKYQQTCLALGIPEPGKDLWVAIARLRDDGQVPADVVDQEQRLLESPDSHQSKAKSDDRHNDRDEEARRKRQWMDLPPAQRAAMNCRDVRFHYWLKKLDRIPLANEDEATAYVRRVAGGHRSNLGQPGYEEQTAAWERIEQRYHEFLQHQRDEGARRD